MICEYKFFFLFLDTLQKKVFIGFVIPAGSFYGLVLVLITFQLNYCLWEKFTFSGLMQQISIYIERI